MTASACSWKAPAVIIVAVIDVVVVILVVVISAPTDAVGQDGGEGGRFVQHVLQRDRGGKARSARHLRRFGTHRGRRSQDWNVSATLPSRTTYHR